MCATLLLQVARPASLDFTEFPELFASLEACLLILHKQSADQDDDDACPFPTPTISYIFPILKAAMKAHMTSDISLIEKVTLLMALKRQVSEKYVYSKLFV